MLIIVGGGAGGYDGGFVIFCTDFTVGCCIWLPELGLFIIGCAAKFMDGIAGCNAVAVGIHML